MEILRVEIPCHVRQVQMSEHQRAVYFEWNGISIKARRGLRIPRAFFKAKSFNSKIVKIEDLKDEFVLARLDKKKKKLLSPTRSTIDLSFSPSEVFKYVLCKIVQNEHLNSEVEIVIANYFKVGTPNMYLINGQDIYNGYLRDHALGKVIGAIKDCYSEHVKNMPVINGYPIEISCEIHDTIKNVYGLKDSGELGGRWDLDNYAYPYLKAFPDMLVAEGKIVDDDRLHISSTIKAEFHPIEDHSKRKLVFIISKTTRSEIIENDLYKRFHANPESFKVVKKEQIEDTGLVRINLDKHNKFNL